MASTTKLDRERNVVAKPIVYGNKATAIPKEPNSLNTHEWRLFVKSATNEPLENFVKKVTFTLHPSFKPQVRVVDKAPFEVVEKGWGEFEAQIKVQFHMTSMKSATLKHQVKLYANEKAVLVDKATVLSETFDELVFSNPTDAMGKWLLKEPNPVLQPRGRDYAAIEAKQLKAIQALKAQVEMELEENTKRHKAAEKQATKLTADLSALQSQS